jgi:hypothetical protein
MEGGDASAAGDCDCNEVFASSESELRRDAEREMGRSSFSASIDLRREACEPEREMVRTGGGMVRDMAVGGE